jgi:hypothetical protein
MRRLVASLAALLVTGCGVTAPTPTPGSYENFIAGLVQRGATVTQQVAGDAGCTSATLHNNAARFDVTFEDDLAHYSIYFFAWRRVSDYDAAATDFASCVASAQQMNSGLAYTTFVASPLRVYGPDWPPALRTAIEQSLNEAT